MHTTNYHDTLITVSTDCPVATGSVPGKPGSIAALQYTLLRNAPHELTSDDLLSAVHAQRHRVPDDAREAARATLFSKPQACLRASPLVKQFGWGLHHDAEGRVALVAMDSEDYARLVADASVRKRPGMRSRRA